MDEPVGEAEVGYRVLVDPGAKIDLVVAEIGAQTVIPVEHGCDSVETEAVQMVFLHPVFAVGKQEAVHLVFTVVEAAGTPGRMMAGRSGIEVEVFVAVQVAKAFKLVTHGVRMHYIHDDGDAAAVGVVHQSLELLGRAKTGAQGEEVAHLITEGAVVGMLLKGHDLKGVVTQRLHAREDRGAEIFEAGHLFLLAAHAYVALVDEGMLAFAGGLVLPLVGLGRIPDLGAEHLGDVVLNHAGHVCRDSLPRSAWPLCPELVERAVAKEHSGKLEFPVAAAYRLQLIVGRSLPVVELAHQIHTCGVGSPFSEHPAAVVRLVQTVPEVVVGCGRDVLATHVAGKFCRGRVQPLSASVNRPLERLQPRIDFIDFLKLGHIMLIQYFPLRCAGIPGSLR